MKTKLLPIAVAISIVSLSFIKCEDAEIPVKEYSVVSNYSLPPFAPDSDILGDDNFPLYPYGSTRVNTPGLSIAKAYRTADGVDHIVLQGTINSGIYGGSAIAGGTSSATSGLFWDECDVVGGGTFSYAGRGDFKVNTSNYPGTADAASLIPIRELDFSSEWKSKGCYTAVTLSGLVGNDKNIEIIETNAALNLWSQQYRITHYPELQTFFNKDYVYYRRYIYPDDPNLFPPNPDAPSEKSDPRGGFSFLISSAANPPTATFEMNYPDGTRKVVVVDYSQVQYREVDIEKVELEASTDPDEGTINGETLPDPDPDAEDMDIHALKYTGAFSHNSGAGSLRFLPVYTKATIGITRPNYFHPAIAPTDMRPATNTITKVSFAGIDLSSEDDGEDFDNIRLASNLEYFFEDPSDPATATGSAGRIGIRLKSDLTENDQQTGTAYVYLYLRYPCYYNKDASDPDEQEYYYDKIIITVTVN